VFQVTNGCQLTLLHLKNTDLKKPEFLATLAGLKQKEVLEEKVRRGSPTSHATASWRWDFSHCHEPRPGYSHFTAQRCRLDFSSV
jgi:hypothetical protein